MSATAVSAPRATAASVQTPKTAATQASERPSSAQATPNAKAYDRLPGVLETFPQIFSELETEQRDRRQLDQTRIDDAYAPPFYSSVQLRDDT
jgi:hypothetical protein